MKAITEKSLLKALLFALLPVFFFSCGQSAQNEIFLSEIGICTSVDNHAKMNEHGYTFIEEGLLGFLKPLEPHESFLPNLEKAQNAEIPVYATNLFLPGHLKAVGEEPMHDEIVAYADTAFRRAEMVGIKRVVFGSGNSRRIPEGFDRDRARSQFVDLLKKLGTVAQKYDVVITIEPLNSREVNFINTSLEGLSIVKDADHPNIQLLVDIFHMMRENEPPSNILEA
ncbi:MAG: TIM barrel protein, partial [Bacteroidota bacterium]